MNRAPGGFRKRHPWWVLGRARYRYKLAPRVVSGCGRDRVHARKTQWEEEPKTIKKDTMNCGEVGGACHKEGISGI